MRAEVFSGNVPRMGASDERFLNEDAISRFAPFYDSKLFYHFLVALFDRALWRSFHQAVLGRRDFVTGDRLRFKRMIVRFTDPWIPETYYKWWGWLLVFIFTPLRQPAGARDHRTDSRGCVHPVDDLGHQQQAQPARRNPGDDRQLRHAAMRLPMLVSVQPGLAQNVVILFLK
jgi:hypothetical protein